MQGMLMDIVLLGITVVSLIVTLVKSLAAWRVTRDEKKRSAARVAALTLAATAPQAFSPSAGVAEVRIDKPIGRAPWAPPKLVPTPIAGAAAAAELPLNQP